MKRFGRNYVIPIASFLGSQRRILLWTLWRSGTHWMAEMLSDLCRMRAWYDADDSQDYRQETRSQLQNFPQHSIVVRHICLSPAELMPLAEANDFQVICLLRDPRDVLASSINMRKFREGYREGLPPFPEMTVGEILDWELQTYRNTYCELVPSWAAAEHPRLQTVRYEDLHQDCSQILTDTAEFLRVQVTADRLKKIVARHSFKSRSKRGAGKVDASSHNRRGIVGDHRDTFTADQQQQMNHVLQDALLRLGYAA